MAAQTGRTVSKWMKFQIGDSANTLRDLPLKSIGDVGLTYDEVDLTALMDAVKGVLTNQPDGSFEATFVFDTLAAGTASGSAAAPVLSGSYTVLQPLVDVMTPRTLAIYFGVRHYWETGEPVFGLARATTVTGYVVTQMTVNVEAGELKAKFCPYPGSAAPGWGTAVLAG